MLYPPGGRLGECHGLAPLPERAGGQTSSPRPDRTVLLQPHPDVASRLDQIAAVVPQLHRPDPSPGQAALTAPRRIAATRPPVAPHTPPRRQRGLGRLADPPRPGLGDRPRPFGLPGIPHVGLDPGNPLVKRQPPPPTRLRRRRRQRSPHQPTRSHSPPPTSRRSQKPRPIEPVGTHRSSNVCGTGRGASSASRMISPAADGAVVSPSASIMPTSAFGNPSCSLMGLLLGDCGAGLDIGRHQPASHPGPSPNRERRTSPHLVQEVGEMRSELAGRDITRIVHSATIVRRNGYAGKGPSAHFFEGALPAPTPSAVSLSNGYRGVAGDGLGRGQIAADTFRRIPSQTKIGTGRG